ncbi:class I SAM-dependent methyltransferase [Paenibacillus sp. PR3]|uniref:Class I SAM-dependent methyltransferase n=1 Tax=Paenibacillus terricola TaxID=2763503 RepID=A0ABR8MZQ2_9BACL|nr:class I SAM-dependent methyltransferase [Paenibacillus terricola]MBD3919669.1 class I SAM-dependent methyltransferase [Paenibacillus terricola]
MTSHEEIYQDSSMSYEEMVSRQPDLTTVIKEIKPFQGLNVLDLGAGSGRLSSIIAPEAKSLVSTDISSAMLDLLDKKLTSSNSTPNWTTVVADHRSLPIADHSIDLVVSGWSICYLTNTDNSDWEQNLALVLDELTRVSKPNGTIIILETMGTGTETPNPPEFLKSYYEQLENKYGFEHRWIRTDYTFGDVAEAKEKTEFFFGAELAHRIEENAWSTVPECAGIWWKHL